MSVVSRGTTSVGKRVNAVPDPSAQKKGTATQSFLWNMRNPQESALINLKRRQIESYGVVAMISVW
jgi:hypothetical protein